MNLLMKCAYTFQHLMNYQYHFTLGRKGITTKIILGFSETDFHHLAGLHKLKDLELSRQNRNFVFRKILEGHITYDTLAKSVFLPRIQSRLYALPHLEAMLDQEQLIFRYSKKYYPYSSIESEFLLKMKSYSIPGTALLFMDQSPKNIYYCRSFFPLEKTDYSKRQMKYTVLKKEKKNLATSEILIQYDRLTLHR